ncbi:uncharacterized protein PAC_12157 [Phialocephala subalpina]|uniref:Uncharacterized protein n=1 Tax=Phialocephala subalpina TaxID=576137 RepID=A0A1L7XB46_9HELO|nr:uncharacterized protein PAC_12157 [Phialocephala subalpina]
MAQGAVATMVPSNGAPLTAEELREILEYDKIVQFRDAIFAGTHPRIKIPAHLVTSTRNIASPSSSSTPRANMPARHATPGAQPPYNRRPGGGGTLAYATSGTHNEEASSSLFNNKSPYNQRPGGVGTLTSSASKSEINPILLEKSDDLIKAEIQLQRQRLERGLREQIEKQRLEAKALLQTSESLPNFDLSEVLSKALEIVHPSTSAEAEPSVGARSASDSFDENTFYSSQHDSPMSSASPRASDDPVVVQSQSGQTVDERPAEIHSAQNQVEDREVVMTGTSLSNNKYLATPAQSQPHSQNAADSTNLQVSRMDTSNSDSSMAEVASAGGQPPGRKWQTTNHGILRQAFDDVVISPVMRAHNLSPLAPQPSRVSPLATARDPPMLRDTAAVEEVQAPQVTALRTQIGGISSTDSSPKGTKGPDKKKEKKKQKGKRKAKDSLDTPDSPYIKPEPRSPSPYAVAPLPRPQKRQRQAGQYAAELNYDEPRHDPEEVIQGRPAEQYREVPVSREYERVEERYEPEVRRPEPVYRRIEREDDGYRRVEPPEDEYQRLDGGQYARRPQSPAVFALPYVPGEIRPRAASHAITERRVYEEPRYYREPAIRASVRPDADRERSRSPVMRPPPQPLRLVVDEYGRKFYEPIPATSMRQSVAPPIRYREPEVAYERAPVRAISGRAPIEVYEDEGVVYRRPSPALAAPRRVVTQPEYSTTSQPEYREYRQREYSVRPTGMAPPGEEYVQMRAAPERRQMSHFEEAPREYIRRAPSVHPEAVRYEVPREYVGRMQSVRPEVPLREYGASVRPEARREMLPQSQRESSVRPVDAIPPRREHLVGAEGERYYGEVPRGRAAEIAFIERPRARESSVLVYADDVRKEVYR